MYPNYQILIYCSLGPQSQHYPRWQSQKYLSRTSAGCANYLNSTPCLFFFKVPHLLDQLLQESLL